MLKVGCFRGVETVCLERVQVNALNKLVSTSPPTIDASALW
jgi:hypothetical protein